MSTSTVHFRLKPILEARGLTIQAFADGAGIGYRTAHDLVDDRCERIGRITLNKVCTFLDIDPGDLIIREIV